MHSAGSVSELPLNVCDSCPPRLETSTSCLLALQESKTFMKAIWCSRMVHELVRSISTTSLPPMLLSHNTLKMCDHEAICGSSDSDGVGWVVVSCGVVAGSDLRNLLDLDDFLALGIFCSVFCVCCAFFLTKQTLHTPQAMVFLLHFLAVGKWCRTKANVEMAIGDVGRVGGPPPPGPGVGRGSAGRFLF